MLARTLRSGRSSRQPCFKWAGITLTSRAARRGPPRTTGRPPSGSQAQQAPPIVVRVPPRGSFPPPNKHGHDWLRILAAGGAIAVPGVGYFYFSHLEPAPYSGRKRFMLRMFSAEQMGAIGEQTYNQVLSQYRGKILPPTHQASRSVRRVGLRIAQANGLDTRGWSFTVIEDDTPNAFVMPGGKVCVFTGLFQVAPNEEALGAVLGHEIGHAVANHSGEKLSKAQFTKGLVFLLFAVMAMLGVDLTYGMQDLTNFVTWVTLELPNSRTQELEADYIGMKLMAKACYDPRHSHKVFERFEKLKKAPTGFMSKLMGVLSTHPSDRERIEAQTGPWLTEATEEYHKAGCDAYGRHFIMPSW